jgi:alanine racemase
VTEGAWTSLRVDTGAIRDNARVLCAAAGRARMLAVVKADAYGHGAVPVSLAALEGGASGLAVFSLGEARELRAAGIGAQILVLGPLGPAEWGDARALGIECCVWTPEAVRAAGAAAGPGEPAPIHLKLDTGMGRLGARAEDVAALADAADAESGVSVVGVMTHFASADQREGENSGFMREQLVRFRAAGASLATRFPGAALHASNSAGLLRDPGAAFDMVRCGIALYGCDPFGDDPAAHGLRPAMSLSTRVASLKTLRSRESVGYGRRWRAARGALIATLPVGYADGYLRILGGRAHALIGGARAPVIGAVSMNQIALDLGPEGRAAVGDEVVLLGTQGAERITAEELAAHAETINYEITCALGARGARTHL